MILPLCYECCVCHLPAEPCKPQRKQKARAGKVAPTKKQPARLERDISKYPEHIQKQIRAQL